MLCHYPNPVLLKVASPLSYKKLSGNQSDNDIYKIINIVKSGLYQYLGYAINAPQLGYSAPIIAYDFKRVLGEKDAILNPSILINPVLQSHGSEEHFILEPCKSLPNVRYLIKRYKTINIGGYNEDGQFLQITFEGLQASIIQHQMDHLSGKLLLDYIPTSEQARFKWYVENTLAIRDRLKHLYSTANNSVIYKKNGCLLIRAGDIISMSFFEATDIDDENLSFSGVMSSINLQNHCFLINNFSKALMLSLVFSPHPEQLYMFGFGGGIVPMNLHHYLPNLKIEGSEIDPTVAELACSHFGIQRDQRMNFTIADGMEHLGQFENAYFDILLLDTFDGSGKHPDNLATVEFYKLCQSKLKAKGVIATNLVKQDSKFEQKVATFVSVFKYCYRFEHKKGNYVVYGSNTINIDLSTMQLRAIELQNTFHFPISFPELIEQIQPIDKNNITPSELL